MLNKNEVIQIKPYLTIGRAWANPLKTSLKTLNLSFFLILFGENSFDKKFLYWKNVNKLKD